MITSEGTLQTAYFKVSNLIYIRMSHVIKSWMASLNPNTRFVTSLGVAIAVALFLITGTWTVAGRLGSINAGQTAMRSEFQSAVAEVKGQLALMNANRWTRDDMARWASEFARANGSARVPQVQRSYGTSPAPDPDGG